MSDYDIAILGAGPAGSALALMLARMSPAPERIALLQSDSSSAYGHVPSADPRVLALNHGSRVLLESLGGWPEESAPIRTIHVSQRGRLGRTVIRNSDFGVPQLGCVVRYTDLHENLARAVKQTGIQVLSGAAARVASQDAYGVEVVQGERSFRARLAVQADGSPAGPARREYVQTALITTARVSLPRDGWAFERFTREGPLAVLPHPEGGGLHSIVWCSAPENAHSLKSLDRDAFSEALTNAFGTRLGRFSVVAPIAAFPLALNYRDRATDARTIAIGNALQTLHPVAGQGLNLGLRDVATLAAALRPWLAAPDTDPASMLQHFERQRRPDRLVTTGLTDMMSRAFATRCSLVDHAAGIALLSLDISPVLRAPLARHLLQGLRF